MMRFDRSYLFVLAICCLCFGGAKENFSQVRSVVNSSVSNAVPVEWNVTLNPKDAWFDTGISVRQGDVLKISASGTVIWDRRTPNGTVRPDGTGYTADTLSRPEDFPLPSARCGSLVIKIGNSVYAVGSEARLTADESGTVRLMVNDRLQSLGDNSGSFSANIKIIRPIQTYQAKGLTIDLYEARLAGGTVTLEMTVTSHEEERGLTIHVGGYSANGDSELFDDQGNRYKSARGTVANNSVNGMVPMLIREVPTRLTVTFEDIPPQARSISSAQISFWTTWPVGPNSTNGTDFTADFRKVPFSH